MIWMLAFLAALAVVLIVFLEIPYSKTKAQFQRDIDFYTGRFDQKDALLTAQDILGLPEPVRRHLHVSGRIGKPWMTTAKASITAAPLRDTNHKPPMMVDYTLCSFAEEPVRLAYIRTSMFGVPFEGYDSTQNGIGFMKGVLGKFVTMFHQAGAEMDKAQLLTYLGECFLIPCCLLSGYITWESIDSTHAKATIAYKDVTGSGVFTFDEQGFVRSFQTEQRARIGNDGSVDYPKWSLVYGGFQEMDGIFCPTQLKTIWHASDGDLVYFEAEHIKFVQSGAQE